MLAQLSEQRGVNRSTLVGQLVRDAHQERIEQVALLRRVAHQEGLTAPAAFPSTAAGAASSRPNVHTRPGSSSSSSSSSGVHTPPERSSEPDYGIACPTCGAPKGKPCFNPRTKLTTAGCAARHTLALPFARERVWRHPASTLVPSRRGAK